MRGKWVGDSENPRISPKSPNISCRTKVCLPSLRIFVCPAKKKQEISLESPADSPKCLKIFTWKSFTCKTPSKNQCFPPIDLFFQVMILAFVCYSGDFFYFLPWDESPFFTTIWGILFGFSNHLISRKFKLKDSFAWCRLCRRHVKLRNLWLRSPREQRMEDWSRETLFRTEQNKHEPGAWPGHPEPVSRNTHETKTNILEAKNEGLVQMIFLFKLVIFWFQPFVFWDLIIKGSWWWRIPDHKAYMSLEAGLTSEVESVP